MALVLEQLQFSVATEQLDLAAQKIRKLGEELGRLRKPLDDLDKPLGGSGGGLAGPNSPVGQKPQREVKTLDKLLEKLNNTYLDMGRGFSKGEASILNQARSLGAMKDQLSLVEGALKNIKELNKDPFDSSLGGVRSITQEFERLTQRANLAAQGIMLTTKQLGEYSRLAAEARSKTIGEGLSLSSPEGQARMNQLLKEAQTDYLKAAASVNQLTEEERQRLAVLKEQEKAQRLANSASIERAKLQDDLILREQKLAFVNKELAAGLTTASANALFKYEKDLRAVGTSTEEVIKRTTAFRTALLEKQSYSGFKKLAEDVNATRQEVNHLARAVSVQLGDVFVSLAGGMNPFMVAIQQGDQIRGALEQAAAAGQSTDKVMKGAFQSMANSFIMVGKIVKDFVVDGVQFLGKSMMELGTKAVPGMQTVLDFIEKRFPTAFSIARVGIGLLTTGFVAFGAAAVVSVIAAAKEQENLNRALTLTGASLGLSSKQALEYAKSMESLGISQTDAIRTIAEMAKVGGFTKDQINLVTEAAVGLEKYGGVAIEETVKKFSEIGKDPVKALIEYGKQTGLVTVEQIKHIKALDESGKKIQAVNEAMAIMGGASVKSIQRLKDESGTLVRFWISIVGLVKQFKDFLLGIGRTDFGDEAYDRQIKNVERLRQAVEATGSKSYIHQYVKAVEELAKMERLRNTNSQEYTDNTQANSQAITQYAAGLKDAKEAEDKAKKAREDAAKQLEKDRNLYEDIIGKSEGLNKTYNDSVDALDRLLKAGKNGGITQWEYNKAFQALYEQQPGYIKQQQEMKKGVDDLNKSTTDFNNKILESQAATAKEREELASITAMLGMTEEQQKTYTIEYQKSLKLKQLDIDLEKELRAIRQDPSIADNPYIQYDREQKAIQANAAKRQLVEDQASYEIAKKQAEEFKKVQDDISGIIADALFEGGKKGADSLKNYLKTTFRKYVIDVIINPIVGSLMGASGVQGASSSLLGNMGSSLLSNAVTGISGVASAFGTAFSNAALSTVQGWVGMSGTAAQMGTSLANAGYFAGSAAGTTASGIGASIGAYAPYALAAVVALDQLGYLDAWSGDPDAFLVQQATGSNQRYRNSVTSRLGTVGFVNGNATIMRNGRLVSEYGETQDVSSAVQKNALDIILNLDNAIADVLSESQIKEITDNLSGWFKKSWSFSGGMLENWIASRYETILLQLDSTFGKVSDYKKEGEKLSETTVRLITNFATVKNTFEDFGIATDVVTAKFATNFADMLGGINNFSSAMQYFYDNFFSDEEKIARASTNLNEAFTALGLSLPETKGQFRALLEGALSSGNKGLSASLLAIMPAFNEFITANEELASSVNETVDSIQQEINRLRGENLTDSIVQGTALRAEFDIMSALARGGDITALAKLPEYSQAIEKNMMDFASSASDVIFARALLAQSLSDTMSSLGGNTTIVPTSVSGLAGSTSIATTGAADLTASVTSQGDLVSVLIAEIQGLRAEVRADVSANTKTSKILERANQDGETLSVTVVA